MSRYVIHPEPGASASWTLADRATGEKIKTTGDIDALLDEMNLLNGGFGLFDESVA